MKVKLLVTIIAGALLAPVGAFTIADAAPRPMVTAKRSDCNVIVAELKRQGAPNWLAESLGRRIAWRESGCRAAFVHDRDDWSYSRFGLNAGARGQYAKYWRKLCKADVRWDTRNLSIDVRCALAIYKQRGFQPWAWF